MAKYIKGKDGKFKGSIGDGKTRIPTASAHPVGLTRSLVDLDNSRKATPSLMTGIDFEYDPIVEAEKMTYAMGKGGSFSERRQRRQLRKALENKFGAIDWSLSEAVTIADDADDFDPFAQVEPVAPVIAPEPRREQGSDSRMLEILSGQRGTLWLRGKDDKFHHAGAGVRMLFMKPGDYSTAKDSEWYTKDHVLIQYGTYAQRYDVDDVSFSSTER
jgi:hypothetical protein